MALLPDTPAGRRLFEDLLASFFTTANFAYFDWLTALLRPSSRPRVREVPIRIGWTWREGDRAIIVSPGRNAMLTPEDVGRTATVALVRDDHLIIYMTTGGCRRCILISPDLVVPCVMIPPLPPGEFMVFRKDVIHVGAGDPESTRHFHRVVFREVIATNGEFREVKLTFDRGPIIDLHRVYRAEEIERLSSAATSGFVETRSVDFDFVEMRDRSLRLLSEAMSVPLEMLTLAPRRAETASIELMKGWLSPRQLEQYERTSAFDVVGCATGRRYRITESPNYNVIDLAGERELCFLPLGANSTGDRMLAQKIALETDEVEALRIANPRERPPIS